MQGNIMSRLSKFAFLSLILLLAGCSHPNPLVGTWVGTETSSQGVVVSNTWTFSDNGKNVTYLKANGGVYAGRTLSSVGTYTLSGRTLSQTIDSISEPGRTYTNPNPVTSTFQYNLKGNTLTLTGGGLRSPLIFTRQSSS
jgi:hypothetical protein